RRGMVSLQVCRRSKTRLGERTKSRFPGFRNVAGFKERNNLVFVRRFKNEIASLAMAMKDFSRTDKYSITIKFFCGGRESSQSKTVLHLKRFF
ncbi:MAG: hypothetical protein AAB209_10135, partial [Bacteroidota bacterium]